MPESPPQTKPLDQAQKVRLAAAAFRQFHAECFWYMRKDLAVGLDDIDEIARGLRQNGGRRGYLLAERLCR